MENTKRTKGRGRGRGRGSRGRGRGRRGRKGGGGGRGGQRRRYRPKTSSHGTDPSTPRKEQPRAVEAPVPVNQQVPNVNAAPQGRGRDSSRGMNGPSQEPRVSGGGGRRGNRYTYRGGRGGRRRERKGSYKDSRDSDEEYDRNSKRWLRKNEETPVPVQDRAPEMPSASAARRVEAGVERVAVGVTPASNPQPICGPVSRGAVGGPIGPIGSVVRAPIGPFTAAVPGGPPPPAGEPPRSILDRVQVPATEIRQMLTGNHINPASDTPPDPVADPDVPEIQYSDPPEQQEQDGDGELDISIDYSDPVLDCPSLAQNAAAEPATRSAGVEAQATAEAEPSEKKNLVGRKAEPDAKAKEEEAKKRKAKCDADTTAKAKAKEEDKKQEQGDNGVKWRKLQPGPRNTRDEERLFSGKAPSGINFDKYDDVQVQVRGRDVPKPHEAFNEANFHELLLANINLANFSKPTPVQKFSIPICREKRDLMACAQTGSGKTGGFLFPILQGMLEDSENKLNEAGSHYGSRFNRGRSRRFCAPECLILSPTRELAMQIHKEAEKFSYRTPLATVCVFGGEDIRRQVDALKRGCNICIATPGRLVDLISRRRVVSMSKIRYLCFDEADRMLDMGFEPQIRQIIQDSDMPEKEHRQTLMFSATFPKPIQKLAQDFLRDYVFLSVGRVGATCSLITQKLQYAEESKKKEALIRVLPKCSGLTLIFVERKKSADYLTEWLYEKGWEAVSIHGDRSQDQRRMALDAFKTGRCPILVATDVAARGLDIDNVTDVINYDMPSSIDTYVHRIGRTGRRGNLGTSITFINERNRNVLHDLFHSLRENKQETPDWFVKLYRSSGTLRTSYRSSSRFGAADVRQSEQEANVPLGKAQVGLSGGGKIQGGNDGWGDDGDADADGGWGNPAEEAKTVEGDGWDSD
uniref:RNA helicase n=1 Tax=Lotharella globosa TaxID=91324 RepID=A0A7S4DLH6_9EUKA